MGNIETCTCTDEIFRGDPIEIKRRRKKKDQYKILETMNSLTHDEKRSCKQTSILQLYAQRIKESVIEIEQKKLNGDTVQLEKYKDRMEKIKIIKMEKLRQQVKAVPILSSTMNSTINTRRSNKYNSNNFIDF